MFSEKTTLHILARKQRRLLLNTGIGLEVLTGESHEATSKIQRPKEMQNLQISSLFSFRLHGDRGAV